MKLGLPLVFVGSLFAMSAFAATTPASNPTEGSYNKTQTVAMEDEKASHEEHHAKHHHKVKHHAKHHHKKAGHHGHAKTHKGEHASAQGTQEAEGTQQAS